MLNMLDASYDGALDLCPVDAVVQLFVHEPYGAYIVAAHNVHAQGIYRRGFGVVWCSDDALDSVAEDLVSPSVSKGPSQDQSAAVSRAPFLSTASSAAFREEGKNALDL